MNKFGTVVFTAVFSAKEALLLTGNTITSAKDIFLKFTRMTEQVM